MKNYFFYENKFKILNFFFKKHKVFLFKNLSKKTDTFFEKYYLSEDISNYQDWADIHYQALKINKKIFDGEKKNLNPIIQKAINKNRSAEIIKALYADFLIKKIKEIYKLENLYICGLFTNLKLLKYLKKNNYLSKNFKISIIFYFISFFFNFFEKLYFSIKIIILPEFILFLCKKNKEKIFYNYAFNIYANSLKKKSNKEFEFLDIGKNLKEKFLVIIDLQLRDKLFGKIKQQKQLYQNNNNQNVIYINEIFKNISPFNYLKSFYKIFFIERFKLIFSLNSNYKEIYRYLLTNVSWKIFFKVYGVNKFLTSMQPLSIATQQIQKENSMETIFLYFSTTPNLTRDINKNDAIDHLQYNFMNYSTLVANKVSINYLNKNTNNFENFKDFGNLVSNLASKSKNKKKLIKNILNLNHNRKIIGIFDNSFGEIGVLNKEEYLSFLEYLDYLTRKYYDFYFLIIHKGRINKFNLANSSKINFLLKKLSFRKNFINIDNKLSTFETLAISDVVICQPITSLIFESLMSEKLTLIYDNRKNFLSRDEIYSRVTNNININNIKYKYRILDKEVLNKLKFRSKICSKMLFNGSRDEYLRKLIKYLEK